MGSYLVRHLDASDNVLGERHILRADIIAELYGFIGTDYEDEVSRIVTVGSCGFRQTRLNPYYGKRRSANQEGVVVT